MRVFLSLIVTLLLVLPSVPLSGQNHSRMDDFIDDPTTFGQNNVSISLLPIFQNGFELSYDRKIIHNQWVKISPIYYRIQDYTHSMPTDLRLVQGYGFKLQHKYFAFHNRKAERGLFLSYGPGFQHFDLQTKGGDEVAFNKYGLECVIGLHKVVSSVFFFEIYAGLATAYLQNKSPERVDWREVLKNHNQIWFDYGVTGNYFTLGFNLGVLF